LAKPHGRPLAMSIHVSIGERNQIECNFGKVKTEYGLNRIKARHKGISENLIATILLVLNLFKSARVALLYYLLSYWLSFLARLLKIT